MAQSSLEIVRSSLSFLDLPREIRDLCYLYLLTLRRSKYRLLPDEEELFPDEWFLHIPYGFAQTVPYSIFLLSRQINEEVGYVIYRSNPLVIELDQLYSIPRREGKAVWMPGDKYKIIGDLAASPLRQLVKSVVIRFSISWDWFKGRDGPEIYFQDDSREAAAMDSLITTLEHGPILNKLTLVMRMHEGRVAKRSNDRLELSDIFARPGHRVQEVKLEYEAAEAVGDTPIQEAFHSKAYNQLDRLHKELLY